MKLTEKNTINLISPKDMPMNSVGIIRKWGESPHYIGEIVKKMHMRGTVFLISLNRGSNIYWTDINNSFVNEEIFAIELLKVGDTLTVE